MKCPRCKGRMAKGKEFCSEACETGRKACPECGKQRRVPRQIRPRGRFCTECSARRKREYHQRYYAENRDQVKAKVQAYREAHADEINEAKRAYYQANREEIRARQNAYAREHMEEQRERQRLWYRANRERAKAMAERWRRNHPDRVRAARERYERRLKADPARLAERRESQRMSERLRAERNGKPMKVLSPFEYVQRYGSGRLKRLPIDPLLPFLKEVHRERGELESFAAGAGLSQSFVERLVFGHSSEVSLPDADRLCVQIGLHVNDVYGEVV